MKYYITLSVVSFIIGILVLTQVYHVDAKINDDDGASTRAIMSEGHITSYSETSTDRCTTTTFEHLVGKNLQQLQKVECEKK